MSCRQTLHGAVTPALRLRVCHCRHGGCSEGGEDVTLAQRKASARQYLDTVQKGVKVVGVYTSTIQVYSRIDISI